MNNEPLVREKSVKEKTEAPEGALYIDEDDVDMSGVLDDYDDDEINMSGV